jgi:N-acyl homoserine lactone hydrolase
MRWTELKLSPAAFAIKAPVQSDPYYVPVGLGSGSRTNTLLAIDEMIKRAGGETRRVIPAHKEGLKEVFPSRIAKNGLRVTEIALADGERSRVK